MELISEFAWVEVERNDEGNGPRLMIRDLRTGVSVYLDPLELETLAWTRHDELAPFLDPSYKRWSSKPDDSVSRLLQDLETPRQ